MDKPSPAPAFPSPWSLVDTIDGRANLGGPDKATAVQTIEFIRARIATAMRDIQTQVEEYERSGGKVDKATLVVGVRKAVETKDALVSSIINPLLRE